MDRFLKITAFLSLAALLTAPCHVDAATAYYWRSDAPGTNFNDMNNWDVTTPWVAGDLIYVGVGAGNTPVISSDPGVTFGQLAIGYPAGGRLSQTGGTLSAYLMYIGCNYTTSVYSISGGTLRQQSGGSLPIEYLGNAGEGHILLSGTGSNVVDWTLAPGIDGGVGTIELSGNSSLSFKHLYAALNGGTAAIFVTGNAAVTASPSVDAINLGYDDGGNPYNENSLAILDISGGTYTTTHYGGYGIKVGGAGGTRAVLSVSGTGKFTGDTNSCISFYSGGIVNIGVTGTGGGTVEIPYLRGNGGLVNFHGGTLKANVDAAEYFTYQPAESSFFGVLNVYSEGAVIDSNGHNIEVSKPLEDPAGNGVSSVAFTPGSGYVSAPVVNFLGGDGSGATAVAEMESDGAGALKIKSIKITNPGTYYSTPPTPYLVGGGGSGTVGTVGLTDNASGGLRKLGDGVLTLSAYNSYTGPTTVEKGSLSVTGYVPGNVEVFSGATLKGTGTVNGATTLRTGGAIDPGTSPGTIYLGALKLQTGSTLHFDGTDAYNIDQIAISNNVTEDAAGSSVTVNVDLNLGFTPSSTLSLITAASLDPNNKITFTLPGGKPVLDSSDGLTTPALLSETPTALNLLPGGAIADPQWNSASGANLYSNRLNWNPSTNPPSPPMLDSQRAMFTRATLSGPVTVNLDASPTLSSVVFDNGDADTASYTIAPAGGSLTMQSSIALNWHITALNGAHAINANIALAKQGGASVVRVAGGAQLTLGGVLSDLTAGEHAPLNIDAAFGGSGNGAVVLTGANTYTGPTVLKRGILKVPGIGSGAAPNPLGQSDSSNAANLVLQGGVLEYTGAAGGNINRAFTVAGTAALQLDNNANLSSPIVGTSADTLNKIGTGNMTLVYPAGLTTPVNLGILGGNASIAAGNSVSISSLTIGSAAGNGFTQTGGTVSTNGPDIQTWPPVPGLCLGQDAGTSGSYQISGGTLNVSGGAYGYIPLVVGGLGSGVFSQTGGTVNVLGDGSGRSYAMVGWLGPGTDSVMSLTGGLYRQHAAWPWGLWVAPGGGGNGVLNIGGNADVDMGSTGGVWIASGNGTATGTTGIVNVGGVDASKGGAGAGGGILRTRYIIDIEGGVAQQSILNLHGGTIQATTSAAPPYGMTFLGNPNPADIGHLTHAYVYSEGAVFDTNDHNITVGQPLEDPNTAGGQGVTGITLDGTGSGYLGEPVVTIIGNGVGATARAIMNAGGGIDRIVITNPGTGYYETPIVLIAGGGGTAPTVTGVSLDDNASGGLTKLGNGILTLAGNNTYTGLTSVEAGGLKLAYGANITGDVDVAGGAVFGGSGIGGTVAGALTLQSGSRLAFEYDGVAASTVSGMSAMPAVNGTHVVDFFTSAASLPTTQTVLAWNSGGNLAAGSLIPATDTIGRCTFRLDFAVAGQVSVVCNTIANEWQGPASGIDWNYFTGGNWTSYIPGNTSNDLQMQAVFGASGSAGTVAIDSNLEISSLIFDRSDGAYTLAGNGTITLASSVAERTQITVLSNPETTGHTVVNDLVLNNPTNVSLGAGAILSLTGAVSGPNGLAVSGTSGSNLLLAGPNGNTYEGPTEVTSTLFLLGKDVGGPGHYAVPGDLVVHSGVVILYGNEQLPPTASLTYDPPESGGWAPSLILYGHSQTLASISENWPMIENTDLGAGGLGATSDGALTINNTAPCTYGGTIRDTSDPLSSPYTVSITKDGPATLTLTGTLAYTGPTTITDGVLQINATNTLVGNINGAGTLGVGGTGTILTASGSVDLGAATIGADDTLLLGGTSVIDEVTGSGTLNVATNATLTSGSITVGTLSIGGGSRASAPAPIPEPSTWLLLILAGLGAFGASRRR